MVKKIFEWIWISILLLVAIFFIFFLTENDFKINIIGGGILALLSIRRILLLYGKTSKGNKNVYFLLFLLGFSLPIVYEYGLMDKENQVKILLLYFVLYGSLVSWMGKKGMLGKKMQASIKKADEKAKKQREEEQKRQQEQKEKLANQRLQEKEKEQQRKQEQLTKEEQRKEEIKNARVICVYCGHIASDVRNLVNNTCRHSPTGKHVVYEGGIKDMYVCKHCGHKQNDLRNLVNNTCPKRKDGKKHEPLL